MEQENPGGFYQPKQHLKIQKTFFFFFFLIEGQETRPRGLLCLEQEELWSIG